MAHAKLVSIYSNQRDRAKAMEHIQAAKRLGDRLPEVEKFYINGWTFWWTGTPQEVIRNWAQMGELHPREYPAHRNLGIALWIYQNDFTGAAAAFKRAFALADPSRKPAVANMLGYCLLGSGQAEEAGTYFQDRRNHRQVAADRLPAGGRQTRRSGKPRPDRESEPRPPSPGAGRPRQSRQGVQRELRPKPEGEADDGSPGDFVDMATVLYLQNRKDELSKWVARFAASPRPMRKPSG